MALDILKINHCAAILSKSFRPRDITQSGFFDVRDNNNKTINVNGVHFRRAFSSHCYLCSMKIWMQYFPDYHSELCVGNVDLALLLPTYGRVSYLSNNFALCTALSSYDSLIFPSISLTHCQEILLSQTGQQ